MPFDRGTPPVIDVAFGLAFLRSHEIIWLLRTQLRAFCLQCLFDPDYDCKQNSGPRRITLAHRSVNFGLQIHL